MNPARCLHNVIRRMRYAHIEHAAMCPFSHVIIVKVTTQTMPDVGRVARFDDK